MTLSPHAPSGPVSARRLRFRISICCQALALAICAGMALMVKAQSSDVKIAVLQTRANQIDAHLQSTDQNISDLSRKIDKLSESIAEMQGGAEVERYAGWSVCGLLSGSSILVSFKRRREE